MYPWIRVAAATLRANWQPKLGAGETHSVRTICYPWDIDFMVELNNGRSLTILDIGRFGLAIRSGLIGAIRRRGWGLTMAGASVQYHRRVRPFDRIEIRSRAIGRDARFLYLEQHLLARGQPAHHVVYRSAVVGPDGIVPTDAVAAEMGNGDWNPELPEWIRGWSAAETLRPWPPDL